MGCLQTSWVLNVSELRDEVLAEVRRRNGGVLPAEMEIFAETRLAFAEDREPSSVLDSGGLPEPLLAEASDQQVEPAETGQVEDTPALGDSPPMGEATGSSQPGRTWQALAIAVLCLLMLAWILSR